MGQRILPIDKRGRLSLGYDAGFVGKCGRHSHRAGAGSSGTWQRSQNERAVHCGAELAVAREEKINMIKNVRNLSITGVCALILCYILEAAGVSGQNSFFEKLYLYCETLVPVTITMIVFYSTGLINKLHRKNRSSVLDNFPKAIRIIITAVLAFAVAALLKLFLSNVLGL